MKAGSQQSEEQKLYKIWCKSSRNKYIICKSFELFQCEIKEYLETVDPNIMKDLKFHSSEDKPLKESVKEIHRYATNRTSDFIPVKAPEENMQEFCLIMQATCYKTDSP